MQTSRRQIIIGVLGLLFLLVASQPRAGAQTPDSKAPPGEDARAERAAPAVAESGETPSTPSADSPELFLAQLAPDLGNEPASRLRMKFEVTFMKIDVADLEARVAPQASALIEPLVREGDRTDEVEARIVELLMEPQAPILLSMTYLRDSDYGRFSKGLRNSMKEAAESGAITEAERDELTELLLSESSSLSENGVAKGGVLAHHITGDLVRILALAPDGTVQVDASHTNPTLARALRASWFGSRSRFREKLLKSLFE